MAPASAEPMLDGGDSPRSPISDGTGSPRSEGSTEGGDTSSDRSSTNDELRIDTHQPVNQVHVNGSDTSHKRKRSEHDDAGRPSPPGHNNVNGEAGPQHVADRALHMLGDNQTTSPPHPQVNGTGQNGHAWKPETLQHPASNLPTPDTPNGHTGDHRWATTGGYAGSPTTNGDTTGPQRPRKRNFSNRTKTGCGTCRKRKKKCDEQHPTCGNCLKAGHHCLGYSNIQLGGSHGLKANGLTKPVPLQSKNGPIDAVSHGHHEAIDHGASQTRSAPLDERGHPQHAGYATEPSPNEPRNTRPLGYPGPPSGQGPPWPPQQSQPPSASYTKVDLPPLTDLRRGEDMTSSPNRDMRSLPQVTSGPLPPMTQQATLPPPGTYPPPPPSVPSYTQPYYATQPLSQHEPFGRGPPAPAPPPPPPPPPAEYPHHNRGASYERPPSPPHGRQTTSSHNSTTSTSTALPPGSKTFTFEEIERSKMLRHHRYLHLDPTLVWDRRRCEAAAERYNADLALTAGKDDEEIRSSLWKILDPSRDGLFQGRAPLKEKGVLSHKVIVERGFRCSYGYNLKLMDSAYLDRDVFIDDAAKVEIGARSWIGAGTRILTSAPCSDLVDRKGASTERTAQPIIIESEVQIGAGCTIYPGVRLSKGCSIRPGSVVDVNVDSMRTFGPRDGRDSSGILNQGLTWR